MTNGRQSSPTCTETLNSVDSSFLFTLSLFSLKGAARYCTSVQVSRIIMEHESTGASCSSIYMSFSGLQHSVHVSIEELRTYTVVD